MVDERNHNTELVKPYVMRGVPEVPIRHRQPAADDVAPEEAPTADVTAFDAPTGDALENDALVNDRVTLGAATGETGDDGGTAAVVLGAAAGTIAGAFLGPVGAIVGAIAGGALASSVTDTADGDGADVTDLDQPDRR